MRAHSFFVVLFWNLLMPGAFAQQSCIQEIGLLQAAPRPGEEMRIRVSLDPAAVSSRGGVALRIEGAFGAGFQFPLAGRDTVIVEFRVPADSQLSHVRIVSPDGGSLEERTLTLGSLPRTARLRAQVGDTTAEPPFLTDQRAVTVELAGDPAALGRLDLLALAEGARELSSREFCRALQDELARGMRLAIMSKRAEEELLERLEPDSVLRSSLLADPGSSIPVGSGRILRAHSLGDAPAVPGAPGLRRIPSFPSRHRGLEDLLTPASESRRQVVAPTWFALGLVLGCSLLFLLLWRFTRERPEILVPGSLAIAVLGSAVVTIPIVRETIMVPFARAGVVVVSGVGGQGVSLVEERLGITPRTEPVEVGYSGPAGSGPLDIRVWESGTARSDQGEGSLVLHPGKLGVLAASELVEGMDWPTQVGEVDGEFHFGNSSTATLGPSLVFKGDQQRPLVLRSLAPGEIAQPGSDPDLATRLSEAWSRWIRLPPVDLAPGEVLWVAKGSDPGFPLLRLDGAAPVSPLVFWALRCK